MAELKFGRYVFDITEQDVILFNGVCWQLISRRIHRGGYDYPPQVSEALCENFVKKGILIMYKKEREYLTRDGRQMGSYYYKFDIDELNEF